MVALAVELAPARTGTAYWLGIAALDAAGNRSAVRVIEVLSD